MRAIAVVKLPSNSFETIWYFTLLAVTLAAVIVSCLRYAARGISGLWKEGNRSPAAILAGACLTVVALSAAITVNAVMGLGGTHP